MTQKLTLTEIEERAKELVASRPKIRTIVEFLQELEDWRQLQVSFRYSRSHCRSTRDCGDGLLIRLYPIVSCGGTLLERTPMCEVFHQRMLVRHEHGMIPIVLDPRICGVSVGLSATKADALIKAASQSFRGYNRQLRQALTEACGLPRRKAEYVTNRDHDRVVQQAGSVPAVLSEAKVVSAGGGAVRKPNRLDDQRHR